MANDKNTENDCKNNYTFEQYLTEFALDENDLRKCNKCKNFQYEDGTASCSKFDNQR